ncbi:hypothetical protein ECH_0733 [Ehrlichia chaffeensis str. Arkansas]|uniref:Uncharacterized protein n=1 Tax=Ehrlichia chaffeensis (strain ATCC CRL-10679 / Arkansas) TaxID=205920 RepID=Q2GG98_EHRCR|nr:hypothetical protein ECH_0733 [Ehrlichia chaffeensis str. Arkansas]
MCDAKVLYTGLLGYFLSLFHIENTEVISAIRYY